MYKYIKVAACMMRILMARSAHVSMQYEMVLCCPIEDSLYYRYLVETLSGCATAH